jgi:hypothetical protein
MCVLLVDEAWEKSESLSTQNTSFLQVIAPSLNFIGTTAQSPYGDFKDLDHIRYLTEWFCAGFACPVPSQPIGFIFVKLLAYFTWAEEQRSMV